MYDIFGCASDFAHNFRHLMPTTLNCGATVKTFGNIKDVIQLKHLLYAANRSFNASRIVSNASPNNRYTLVAPPFP